MVQIPSPLQYPKNKYLSPNVSLIPNQSDPESTSYLISFYYYNEKLCQIDLLQKNQAKRILKVIKIMGISTKSSLKDNGIDMIKISKTGEYKKLFSGLDDDTELFEHKTSGTNRIFYFTEGISKIHIVAIIANHLETDKQRR